MGSPYFYKLLHIPTNKLYVGSQYSKTCDKSNLFKTYFTSSKYVKLLIEKDGVSSFKILDIKEREDARLYESRYLKKVYSKFGELKFKSIFINRNIAPGILNDEASIKKANIKRKVSNSLSQKLLFKQNKHNWQKKLSLEKELIRRSKLSNSMKGNTSGSHRKITDEYRKLASEKSKGNTNVRGLKWWTDGISFMRSLTCPKDGFILGGPSKTKKENMTKLKLTDERSYYKPFNYPWCYDAFMQSEQMHWLAAEAPMIEDVNDWKNKLSEDEKKFLTHIFRFFTQGDIDVAGAYVNNYLPNFPQPEVRMMLSSFAAREAIHVAAYSHLIETLGMPESTYNEFLQYQEMKDKHDYIESFIKQDENTAAQQIAVFSAFTEGMQLFSSFVMLLNFARFGKMKGMGQIIAWSIADESLHAESMIKLFREFVKENKHIWNDDLKSQLYSIAEKMVVLEDQFIDLAFGISEMQGLSKEDVKTYIRYIADRRLISLGLKGIFKVKKNPLPWVDGMLGTTHSNFFEQKVTDYAKGSLTGSWSEVWASK